MPHQLFERVSNHFTIREVVYSANAERHGVNNMIPDNLLNNAAAVAVHLLEPIRAQFGAFSPESWYRNYTVNKLAGSKNNASQHTQGRAVDLKIHGVTTMRLAEWIRDNLVFDQLILEFYNEADPGSGWVHVSFVDPMAPAEDGAHNRLNVMRTPNGVNYSFGLV